MLNEQQLSAAPAIDARPKSYRWAFILITSLFFMWGLSYGLVDVLNKHFQESLHVTKAQSGLIQAAYFGAYFLIALPAGLFMDKRGFKAGILLGLCLYACGALLFVPAANTASFPFFLFALFVIACGLGCLETAANPYATVLGHPDGAERRLNLSQSFNGLGQFVGPLIGGAVFFSSGYADADSGLDSVSLVYALIAGLVLLIAVFIARTPMPDIRGDQDEQQVEDNRTLWQHKRFVAGVVTLFFYVGAQVGVGAFFINYVTEHWSNITSQKGSYLLSVAMLAFMFGRFFSTWLMGYVSAARLLMIYALINIGLCALVISGFDNIAVIALIAMFFFMSIMFPTIFAIGLKRLGRHTKRASSYLIMAIVGGAIMPYLMGSMADNFSTATAFTLPFCCFFIVAWFGWRNAFK